jgi:hypothetical protein
VAGRFAFSASVNEEGLVLGAKLTSGGRLVVDTSYALFCSTGNLFCLYNETQFSLLIQPLNQPFA